MSISLKRYRVLKRTLLYIALASVMPALSADIPLPPVLPSFRIQAVPSLDKVTPPPEPLPPATQDTKPEIRQGVPVEARILSDEVVEIKFYWASSAGIAVFKRAERSMVAFDRPALFHLEQVTKLETSYYSDFKQIVDREDLSVVSFKIPPGKHLSVQKDGDAWSLFIKTEAPKSRNAKVLNPQVITNPSLKLSYKDENVLSIRTFQDPVTGENLFLMFQPVAQPTKGAAYVDFTTLPSVAGIILAAKADDLAIIKNERSFEVARAGNKPLHLSGSGDRDSNRKFAFPENLFDFSPWSHPPQNWFTEFSNHVFKIIHTSGANRIKARQEAILFLLGTGHFAEASAYAQMLESEYPAIIEDPHFQALKAICFVVTYQPDRAEPIFSTPPYSEEPEIQLWKGAALLSQNNYYEGLQHIIPNIRYLKKYPTDLKNFIAFLAAKASYELDYPGKIFLDFIDKAHLSSVQSSLYDLYAYYLNRKPDEDMSKSPLLQALEQSANPLVRIEAALLRLEKASDDLEKDIALLEDLRFKWRGDDTEVALLMKLAELYEKAKRPSKALIYLRQIHDYFNSYPIYETAYKKGQDLFYEVFMSSKNKPAYEAIALYQEFKELLPTDKRKEIMLDTLIMLYEKEYLYDKAITILEDALNRAQQAPEIVAHRALHLSSLYLERKQYDKVLPVLQKIPASAEQEPSVYQGKQFLTAKLHADQGQLDTALQILQADNSLDSLKLQAELCWQAKKWTQATEIIAKIIKIIDNKNDQRADFILKLAVALVHDENKKGLEIVKQAFSSFMEKSKYKDAFMIITSNMDNVAGSTYQKSLEQLSSANNFNNFLKDFRSKSGL